MRAREAGMKPHTRKGIGGDKDVMESIQTFLLQQHEGATHPVPATARQDDTVYGKQGGSKPFLGS